MIFFKIVVFTLFVILAFNMIDLSIGISLLPKVYACSEVEKSDPINVQKACNRRVIWH